VAPGTRDGTGEEGAFARQPGYSGMDQTKSIPACPFGSGYQKYSAQDK